MRELPQFGNAMHSSVGAIHLRRPAVNQGKDLWLRSFAGYGFSRPGDH